MVILTIGSTLINAPLQEGGTSVPMERTSGAHCRMTTAQVVHSAQVKRPHSSPAQFKVQPKKMSASILLLTNHVTILF